MYPGNAGTILRQTKAVERFDNMSDIKAPSSYVLKDTSPSQDSKLNLKCELWKDINGTPVLVATSHVSPSEDIVTGTGHSYIQLTDTGTEGDNGSTSDKISYNIATGTETYGVVMSLSGNGEAHFGPEGAANFFFKGAGFAESSFSVTGGI